MGDSFDTKLSPQAEAQFNAWVAAQSRRLGRDLSRDLHDYDLRGLFQELGGKELGQGHFRDTYKKPNHPTFSTESKYSRPGMEGGRWVEVPGGGWEFRASDANLRNMTADRLGEYFRQREPNAKLILPQTQKPPEMLTPPRQQEPAPFPDLLQYLRRPST